MILDDCYGPGYLMDDQALLAACEEYDDRVRPAFEVVAGAPGSVLILTLDCEEFPAATARERAVYPTVLSEMAASLAAKGCAATFCVQLEDSMPVSRRTPPSGIQRVHETLGPDAIGFHCIDHFTTTATGEPRSFTPDYYRQGIRALRSQYGVTPVYFAPPAWVMTASSALALKEIDELKAVRGLQSGPSLWKSDVIWNVRMPYRYHGKIYFPYQYVDWNFGDVFGRELRVDVLEQHRRASSLSTEPPVFMETLGHPFRLAMGRVAENLKVFECSLDLYKDAGISVVSAGRALRIFEEMARRTEIPDWADLLPDLIVRGADLPRDTSVRPLPAKPTLRNAVIAARRRTLAARRAVRRNLGSLARRLFPRRTPE